jgi:TATA-box binding protein (TBP) (component of TFIID and TFIIIB)
MIDEYIRLAIDIYVTGKILLTGTRNVRQHEGDDTAVIWQIVDGHRMVSKIRKIGMASGYAQCGSF